MDDPPDDLLEIPRDLFARTIVAAAGRTRASAHGQHDDDEELGEHWYRHVRRDTAEPASIVRLPTFEHWRVLHRARGSKF
jgi:hypothetical protein